MAKISILIALLLHPLCTRTVVTQGLYTISLTNESDDECGITSYYTDATNRLIPNGEEILPGQWPWLVAIYKLTNYNLSFKFRCIGSIISTRHIITAANCLYSGSNDTIDPNDLYVALGKFALYEWYKEGAINRQVASYKIHPEFEFATTADHDLAILTLTTAVEYNPFIKPICLWPGYIIMEINVSRTGYIVGWGRNELGHHHEEPRMARISIVSEEECRRNNPTFSSIISRDTFCAGLEGHNCDGVDIGGGLVVFNTYTNRYQLRGVASRMAYFNETFVCDPTKYIVFVDAARYVMWIRLQIPAA